MLQKIPPLSILKMCRNIPLNLFQIPKRLLADDYFLDMTEDSSEDEAA